MQRYEDVSKDIFMGDTVVGCDLYLKSSSNGVTTYVLFCREDEQLSRDKKKLLLKRNIQNLYVLSKDYYKCLRYQERNLSNVLENDTISSGEKSRAIYLVAKNLSKDILQDIRTTGLDLKRVDNWVKHTLGFIFNNEHAFSGLMKMTSHDYYTYTHLVNVAVYGLLFGRYLRLSPEYLNSLGTGTLLHDIGKIDIPSEILNKPGKLTKDEFIIVKRHPEIGYNLLKNKKDIDGNALKSVIQHHENYDGTGYPYGIGGEEIDLNGRISRIIDSYDAMVTRRSYAAARNPFEALNEMKEHMSDCLDKEIFQEFIRFLGQGENFNYRWGKN